MQDQGGDENYNVYAVDPAAAPAAGADVPSRTQPHRREGRRAPLIYQVSKVDPDVIFVGLNDRDAAWHDLYRVRISTGERTLLRKNTDRIAGWEFDLKDQLRLAARTTDKGDTEVLRVDESGFTKIYECSVFETCGPVRFHKDGQRVYMQTNKGDVRPHPARAVRRRHGQGRSRRVGPREAAWTSATPMFSDLTDELIGTVYVDDRVAHPLARQGVRGRLQVAAGQAAEHRRSSFGASTMDERKWIVSASSDVEPGTTYLFDRKAKTLTLQYRIREKLPREALAPMKAIRYKSSRWARDPRVPDAAEGRRAPRTCR